MKPSGNPHSKRSNTYYQIDSACPGCLDKSTKPIPVTNIASRNQSKEQSCSFKTSERMSSIHPSSCTAQARLESSKDKENVFKGVRTYKRNTLNQSKETLSPSKELLSASLHRGYSFRTFATTCSRPQETATHLATEPWHDAAENRPRD